MSLFSERTFEVDLIMALATSRSQAGPRRAAVVPTVRPRSIMVVDREIEVSARTDGALGKRRLFDDDESLIQALVL
jgi:hypothetical protein